MKIAFTICSNNYLSYAKTLGDSLIKENPDYKFVIGLCDKLNPEIDYSFFEPHTILEAEKLGIEDFDKMILDYTIVELNTSIKPFFFKYLFNYFSDADLIIYFDPDIYLFDNLKILEDELENYFALLTPHINSPMPDDNKNPSENTFLNYGLYNLGFLALKKSMIADKILDWWSQKLKFGCMHNLSQGYFVDQLPMNLLPLFYEGIGISKNLGFNMAYWNFHERKFTTGDYLEEKYIINDKWPLVFFHFSNFNPLQPDIIAQYQNRYNINSNPYYKQLFANYSKSLLKNKYEEFKKIECEFVKQRENHLQKVFEEKRKQESLKKKIIRQIRIAIENIFNVNITKKQI